MRESRFTESHIVRVLKEVEGGSQLVDVCVYAAEPLLRMISRLMVEADLPSWSAMGRVDCWRTRPLEMASRSASVSAHAARVLGLGRIPPFSVSIREIDGC
jgi:hypothetical protein